MRKISIFQICWAALIVAGCSGSAGGLPPIEPILDSLRGLPFDEFVDKSFEQFLRRSPELVFWFGLDEQFDVRNDRLDDVSLAFAEQTNDLLAGIRDILGEFQREELTTEQKTTFDAYGRFLDLQVQSGHYLAFDYPLNYYSGLEQSTLAVLNENGWIASRQDAEDQIERFAQAERKLRQAIARAEYCEAQGVVLPRFALELTLLYAREVAQAEAEDLYMYWQFAQALDNVAGLSPAERSELLQRAAEAMRQSVIVGFQEVVAHLEEIKSLAPTGIGLSQFPGGAEAYDYLLLFHTDDRLGAEAVHQLGLQEVSRIQDEIEGCLQDLGYPAGESLTQSFARVAGDGGSVTGDAIIVTYSTLIAKAFERLGAAFSRLPTAPLEIRATESVSQAAYSSPSIDGSFPGIFWAPAEGTQLFYQMPTLAYHETVPGHHLQLALALETPTNLFQRIWSNNAFSEGWALYAERLAEELGWYATGPGGEPADPYGNLGRLQDELLRAARLVVDTGIHAKGWSFEQAASYMRQNVGYGDGDPYVEDEVGRYAMIPGQATAYKTGMLAILKMRERAQQQLGVQFDIKTFHDWILGQGNLPISVVEKVVANALAGNPPPPRRKPALRETAPAADGQLVPRTRVFWNPLRQAACVLLPAHGRSR